MAATERICDSFKQVRKEMCNYPFYPIQSICEQAEFCRDGNAARLEDLYKSALQHEHKYIKREFDFIIEHLRSVMDYIKDNNKRDEAKRQIEDY